MANCAFALILLAALTAMQNEQEKADYVAQTIATYNVIAPDYKLTATPEMRAWEENSMRRFSGYLAGKHVLVPGCGDGRDSRFLRSLGLAVRVTCPRKCSRLRRPKTLKVPISEWTCGKWIGVQERTTGFSPAVACITSTSRTFRNVFDLAGRCFQARVFFISI